MSIKQDAITKMAERLAICLGRDASEFTAETRFEDLNMKSMNYSQLTTFLEEHFDIEVPYMDFRRKRTLEEAAEYIDQLYES